MNRKLKIVYLFVLISGLLWSESVGSGKQGLHPVNLNIHDGVGSLLLNWSFSDSIEAKEINIYKRIGEEDKFSRIISFSDAIGFRDRYLDKNCKALERYFYFIEIKDANGNIFKSDDIRPSFGTSMQIVDQKRESFNSIWDILSHLIKDSFSKYYPNISVETKNAIVDLLSKDDSGKSMWIENFPLEYLDEIRSIMEKPTNLVFQNNILDELQFFENEYRNEFLVTPKEWNQNIKDIYFSTKEKWFLLVDSFQGYSELIDAMPPLLITGAKRDLNYNIINIYVVDTKRLEQNKVILKHNEESVDVEILSSLYLGAELQIKIPNEWGYAELLIEDQIVDEMDFIKNKTIIKTLDRDIICAEDVKGLKLSKEKTDVWLNEIYWDPNRSKLSLEVAGIPTGSKKYIISINNTDLWDIDLDQTFDIQYSDSSFNIDLSGIDEPLTLSYDVIEGDQRRSSELIKLISRGVISSHRLPDGGKWENTNRNTFGAENIDQRNAMDASLIPELFVLYQNYPNPFNSNTRISFDLLQDAVLSLYVTDATGRKKTIFSDKEFYNSGKYNFDWNAESFSTGVYFFTINAEVDGFLPVIFSRKMIYLK